MSVQRTMQQALRRNAFQPATLSRTATTKFAPPAVIAITNQASQKRYAATTKVSQDEGYDILVKQRLNRPVSPHLGIYRPQITWIPSALNRITGCILSGTFYVFGFGYLVAPVFGLHLESTTLVAAFGSLPLVVKVLLKFTYALPFTFHSLNGVRHLVWDMAKDLKNKQVNRTGWLVVGASIVSAAYLAVWA